jgi:hypothetical protein
VLPSRLRSTVFYKEKNASPPQFDRATKKNEKFFELSLKLRLHLVPVTDLNQILRLRHVPVPDTDIPPV